MPTRSDRPHHEKTPLGRSPQRRARVPEAHLHADQNIGTALELFVSAEMEVPPVLGEELRVAGHPTEACALRRCARELEIKRGEDLGEIGPRG